MKNKILLLITIILSIFIIPNKVLAEDTDVEVKSIELVDKTGNAEIVEEASIVDGKVKLNVNLYSVDDSIIYKFIVKNNYKRELIFDKNSIESDNEYVEYEIEYQDDSRIIKTNEEKEVIIKINYKTETPRELFKNGSYDASLNRELGLSDSVVSIAKLL